MGILVITYDACPVVISMSRLITGIIAPWNVTSGQITLDHFHGATFIFNVEIVIFIVEMVILTLFFLN